MVAPRVTGHFGSRPLRSRTPSRGGKKTSVTVTDVVWAWNDACLGDTSPMSDVQTRVLMTDERSWRRSSSEKRCCRHPDTPVCDCTHH